MDGIIRLFSTWLGLHTGSRLVMCGFARFAIGRVRFYSSGWFAVGFARILPGSRWVLYESVSHVYFRTRLLVM